MFTGLERNEILVTSYSSIAVCKEGFRLEAKLSQCPKSRNNIGLGLVIAARQSA